VITREIERQIADGRLGSWASTYRPSALQREHPPILVERPTPWHDLIQCEYWFGAAESGSRARARVSPAGIIAAAQTNTPGL